MLLIPFPFLTSAVLLVLLLALRAMRDPGRPGFGYLDAFFALAAVQSLLIGLRHGYGIQGLASLLPVTAVLLPPLAYASFVRPPLSRKLLWHALPAVLVFFAWRVFPPAIDLAVPLVFLAYAARLGVLGSGQESDMPWARLSDMASSRAALWGVVAALVVSAVADIAIAIDFGRTGGAFLGPISLVVQAVTLIGVGLLLWSSVPGEAAAPESEDMDVEVPNRAPDFEAVQQGVQEQMLHLDPDLNLQRLARKVGVPSKRVSAAVNAVEGVNVSQWINRLRIEHALTQLRDPDRLILDVIYSSGFNTKSSFHREFKRVIGETPSVWRTQHAHREAAE